MPRPQRITRDGLLDAAMQIVDAEGLDALTMRRLGRTVGAVPAMVYRFFTDKSALVEALADRLFAQARGARPGAGSPPAEECRPPELEQLRLVAHGVRRALLAHPALVAAAVRRPPRQEATLRGLDAGLGLLLGAGMDPEAAAKGYQAVLFYTLGFAALEAPFAASSDGGVQDQAETQAVLARLPVEQYPHVAATVEHLYGPDLTAQFDHGLRLLLAGLRAHLPAAEDGGDCAPRPPGSPAMSVRRPVRLP
ncbi:TetR/AcrR family transcriptional regulator [Geodermatophilus sp. SYSU D00742]